MDVQWLTLPEELVVEIQDHVGRLGGDDTKDLGEVCIWFEPETKRCRHHEVRPQVCRDLEIGGKACQLARRQMGLF